MPEHDPESAVEQLLGRADAPPTIDPEARARILSRLREASRGQSAGEVTDLRAGAPANDGASAERPTTPAPQGPRRRWSPLGLALALAACLALFWGLPKLLLQSRAEDPLGDAIARHVADAGARPEAVALADGSVVWLRAGAAVDELDRRRIRVRGEVFLKVAAGRVPFVVETPQGAAQAAGELLIEAGDAQSKIAVARGRAELQGADTPRLRAGEQATLRADAAPEVSVARRLTHMLAWARPLLRENEPAPAVARRGNLVARDPNQAIWGSGAGEWPLPIRRLDVDVVIEDGVARTTLDSTFFNPAQLTLEGFYSFPLPSDAAISRLAMYVDGALMEGGIVERQRGRTIFESIVYQRRDPALLEQMAGNEFRVRVFPLPGRQQKRLFLSYVEPLDELYGAQSLRVPLPELDQPVGAVNISVRVKGADGWTLRSASHPLAVTAGAELSGTWHDEQVVLGDDLLLELRPEGEAPATHAARDGDRWLLRGRPDLGAAAEATARRWVILYDTSASRETRELAAQKRLLAHLLRAIDGDDRFTVIAFDAALRELGPLRPVGEIDPAQVRAWARREGGDHVGATDLAGALTRAAAILRDAEAPASEAPVILYLGDGVVHGDEQAVRRLIEGAGEGVPVIAAALGDPTDMPTLVALAEATGGMTTLIDAGEDLAWRARDLVAAIATPRLVDLEVDLLDSDGQRLDAGPVDLNARALSDGEAVLVTATSSKAPAALRIRGTLDGAPFQQRLTLPPARDDAGYVDTLWARARIAALLADDAEANREAITELGLDNFLVTPFTSLLVVESEAMAERFKLTRPTSTWAPYAAPKSIPVRTEPSERLGDVRRGAYVHRSPLEILVDPSDYANQQGWWGLQEDGAHVLGGLGFVGTGRGGGGVGQGSIGLGNGSLLSGGASERSQVSASLSDLAADVDADAPMTTTGAAAVDEVQATRDLAEKESFKRAEASPTRERRARGSGRFEFGARGLTRGHYYGNAVMRPYPRALSSSGDPRLDDLSAFVPGLLEAGVDHERQRLVAASARAGAGSITPEARALIDRAREAAPTGAFAEAESGDTLEVRGGGALLRRRTIGGYLREEVLYDGAILRTLYPDLDLEVRRDLRGAPTLLYERWAPWVLADADALAAVFVVEAVGERGVRLRRPGAAEADASAIDLHFDARGRLAAIVADAGETRATTRLSYDGAGITVDDGRRAQVFKRVGEAPPIPVERDAVVVNVPYTSLEEADAALAAAEGPAKRSAAAQRLATLVALGRTAELGAALRELSQDGPLRRGELVLASAGLRDLDRQTWAKLRAGLDDGDPVVAYAEALRGRKADFAKIGAAHRGTLPGLLASYRALLVEAERPKPSARALADLEAFLAAYQHHDLAYVVTQRLADMWSWSHADRAAAAWLALADADAGWRGLAIYAAGLARYYRGDMAAAADIFITAFDDLDAGGDAAPPVVDWTVRQAITSRRGEATWHLMWTRWRTVVERTGDPAHLTAFITAALSFADTDAIHRVLARADLERCDLDTGLALVQSLLAAGMEAEARPLLRHLRVLAPDDADVLIAAAAVAEALGDLGQAAASLERAIASPQITDLSELRALYRHAFQLRARLSQASVDGKTNEATLAAALAIAGRWRLEDPDNAMIDELAASLLYAHDRPDAAWRQISSIIERHPAEGSAHARVAALLAREGDLKAADAALADAIAAEPTNPTWLLRRAQNLLATGDIEAATRDLEAIAAGRWQDRFANVVSEAKALRDHFASRGPGAKR